MAERVRRWRWAMALVSGAALALGACGVPDIGAPIADGGVVQGGVINVGGHIIDPPSPGDFGDPVDLVERGLLIAVAGQPDTPHQVVSVSPFATRGADWLADLNHRAQGNTAALPVTVIRVVSDTVKADENHAGTEVTLTAQVVGTFAPATGVITPSAGSTKPIKLVYDVVPAGADLRIASAPNGLFVADSVFDLDQGNTFYTAQPIYFWGANGEMIPDLRYISQELSPRNAATWVVKWLLSGPPKWMGKAAVPTMPSGTVLADAVITQDAKSQAFIVNVKQSQPVKATSEAQFEAEVAWSIPTSTQALQPIELRVNNTPVPPVANLLTTNLAWLRDVAPNAYTVKGGKVTGIGQADSSGNLQLATPGMGGPNKLDEGGLMPPKLSPAVLAALQSPENSDVVYAAIHDATTTGGDGVDVAFVREVKGVAGLWVWWGQSEQTPKFTQVDLPVGDLGAPVWIPSVGALAVLDAGQLYVVTRTPSRTIAVTVPGISEITAISVASDGQRIAYVTSDGRVMIGLLKIGTGTAGPTASALAPHPINIRPTLDSATAVAWSSTRSLVVGGPTGQTAQSIELNVDGVYAEPNGTLSAFNSPITAISSYPLNPLSILAPASPVLVQTSAGAHAGRSSDQPLPGDNPFFEN